ncbi:MAG TPA: Uma2 family endonuclease [Spirochaetota bacterium]|nr:Uma2 family endonuclease [Spirochaetota bacterium]HOS32912.1 Uma2 family endonuclease [Spirochaetota bacterium]HOS56098.1 Uma2 family endonuclease [Spirochaetota bacterium]HPK62299.1 Uma2 family endonuclease [Spirochaetota bacterium]HQF76813.1 Uma2 family endonuclease [Spirochaetota bacterium]
MGYALKKEIEKYTYYDYKNWNDGERYELIDGEVYNMSPAPRKSHQIISMNLSRIFSSYLKGKSCKVFAAPFDVRFPEYQDQNDDDIETVVQPDISIICDNDKLDDAGCKGAPDLIVEILSPHTSRKDLNEKFYLYEKHKVKEYWVIYSYERLLHVYKLGEDGKYGSSIIYGLDDKLSPTIFPELIVDINEVFEE